MLEYLLYKLVMVLGQIIPLRFAYWVALRFADLHYRFDHKARKAVEKNMKHILGPDRSEAVLNNEVRWTFRQFGKFMAEFFRFTRFYSHYVERYVLASGVDHLKEAMAHGKGAIIITAHIGNWELGPCYLKGLGYDVTAVALEEKNPRVNDLLNRQRTKRGVEVLPAGGFLRGCYRTLREGKIVALVGDRDINNSGIKVRFFDKEASFPQGPARISIRTGSPIVPAFFLRRPNDSWFMHIEEPIYPESAGEGDEAVRSIMERYVSIVENVIREHPSQWAMFHDIWDGTPA